MDNNDGPKVVTFTHDKAKADEAEFVRAVENMIKNAVLIARLRRANFLALKAEGFTDAEALVLCQKATI